MCPATFFCSSCSSSVVKCTVSVIPMQGFKVPIPYGQPIKAHHKYSIRLQELHRWCTITKVPYLCKVSTVSLEPGCISWLKFVCFEIYCPKMQNNVIDWIMRPIAFNQLLNFSMSSLLLLTKKKYLAPTVFNWIKSYLSFIRWND